MGGCDPLWVFHEMVDHYSMRAEGQSPAGLGVGLVGPEVGLMGVKVGSEALKMGSGGVKMGSRFWRE